MIKLSCTFNIRVYISTDVKCVYLMVQCSGHIEIMWLFSLMGIVAAEPLGEYHCPVPESVPWFVAILFVYLPGVSTCSQKGFKCSGMKRENLRMHAEGQ